ITTSYLIQTGLRSYIHKYINTYIHTYTPYALHEKDNNFRAKQLFIAAQDHQPKPESCTLTMVVDQPKADEDPCYGIHQIFVLKNNTDAHVCNHVTAPLHNVAGYHGSSQK
uniref:Uncharacterized protein n=1 Tax=Salvator merianae TaxID=96440 RepID=A0A8D0C9T4_SALMN